MTLCVDILKIIKGNKR